MGLHMVFRSDRCNTNGDVATNWQGNTMEPATSSDIAPRTVEFGYNDEAIPFAPVDVLLSGSLTAGGGLMLQPQLALTLDSVDIEFDVAATGPSASFIGGQESTSNKNCSLVCKDNWGVVDSTTNTSDLGPLGDLPPAPRAPCRLDTAVFPQGYTLAVNTGDDVVVFGSMEWITPGGRTLSTILEVPFQQIRPTNPIVFVGEAALQYCINDRHECPCGSDCSIATTTLATTAAAAPEKSTSSDNDISRILIPTLGGIIGCIFLAVVLLLCNHHRAEKMKASQKSRLFATFANPAYISPAMVGEKRANPVYRESRSSRDLAGAAYLPVDDDSYLAVGGGFEESAGWAELHEPRRLSIVERRSDMTEADFGFAQFEATAPSTVTPKALEKFEPRDESFGGFAQDGSDSERSSSVDKFFEGEGYMYNGSSA